MNGDPNPENELSESTLNGLNQLKIIISYAAEKGLDEYKTKIIEGLGEEPDSELSKRLRSMNSDDFLKYTTALHEQTSDFNLKFSCALGMGYATEISSNIRKITALLEMMVNEAVQNGSYVLTDDEFESLSFAIGDKILAEFVDERFNTGAGSIRDFKLADEKGVRIIKFSDQLEMIVNLEYFDTDIMSEDEEEQDPLETDYSEEEDFDDDYYKETIDRGDFSEPAKIPFMAGIASFKKLNP